MVKYYISNKAVEDLSSIWEYTLETWSEAQADIYYRELINAIKGIAERPFFSIENTLRFTKDYLLGNVKSTSCSTDWIMPELLKSSEFFMKEWILLADSNKSEYPPAHSCEHILNGRGEREVESIF